jgi:hypothetical protein
LPGICRNFPGKPLVVIDIRKTCFDSIEFTDVSGAGCAGNTPLRHLQIRSARYLSTAVGYDRPGHAATARCLYSTLDEGRQALLTWHTRHRNKFRGAVFLATVTQSVEIALTDFKFFS